MNKCIDCIHRLNEDCLGLAGCPLEEEEEVYIEEDIELNIDYDKEDRF